MAELFSFISEVGVYPILVLIWLELRATKKSHGSVINYLVEVCPHCAEVKALLQK